MKTLSSKTRIKAMNMVELFIITAMLTIMGLLLLPALMHPHKQHYRIKCTDNLKQIGLAFSQWALDNGDKFPMEVSTNAGGSKELAAGATMFTTFMALSNELSTPRVLLCPNDVNRTKATVFAPGLTNANLSYFVNLDATKSNPTNLLSGDRSLTNRVVKPGRVLEVAAGQPVGWNEELHQNVGNILLVDGSVQQLSTLRLRKLLQSFGSVTNHLAMP